MKFMTFFVIINRVLLNNDLTFILTKIVNNFTDELNNNNLIHTILFPFR